ncbi:hypothetical protein ACJMK2_036601 [Sinanodonta woodiana]|uniref:Activator of Hsp90 ATPase AHSA1-like N-terminal domain-containing protein n=1 Tax=Sinanodonta woodiana TaxID=1069815 RepID=A0ABD3WJK5_SINWO
MAKWGEGDPRWIVEERPDATNVNNWHWTEKNCTQWSKDKIRELLTGLTVEDDEVFCEIKELTKLEGEATANNRKAKLIFFYEFEIKGEWSGKMKSGDQKYKGKFEIPNLSEENDASEIDVNVTSDKDTDEAYKIKEFLRKKGTSLIQEQLAKYINALKTEYSKDVIKPTKDNANVTSSEKASAGLNKAKEEMNKMIISGSGSPSNNLGVKINTKKLVLIEDFRCSVADLYNVLTDRELVQAFTGGPAILEVEKGGRFSLLNNYVTGEFVELVPEKKIVQKWRIKTWPDAHYSEVTFEFEQKDDKTVLRLTQLGVPESEYDKTIDGWQMNYWGRIKQVFGYGDRYF